jgi:hypothetical protein
MSQLVIRLGQLVLGFLVIFGPLIFLFLLLEVRDRRQSTLYGVILKELNSPDLRGLFAVEIQCGIFSRQDTVIVDLWNCPKEQVWDAIIKLSAHLPSKVRLVVNGMADPCSQSTLTLKVQRNIPSVSSVSSFR